MTNDYGYSLGEALANRFDAFFKFHDTLTLYKILKIVFYIFTIPFLLVSIAELLILTTFKYVGKLICNILALTIILSFLGILLGFVFGAIYYILSKVFEILFYFFILPEILFDTNY